MASLQDKIATVTALQEERQSELDLELGDYIGATERTLEAALSALDEAVSILEAMGILPAS